MEQSASNAPTHLQTSTPHSKYSPQKTPSPSPQFIKDLQLENIKLHNRKHIYDNNLTLLRKEFDQWKKSMTHVLVEKDVSLEKLSQLLRREKEVNDRLSRRYEKQEEFYEKLVEQLNSQLADVKGENRELRGQVEDLASRLRLRENMQSKMDMWSTQNPEWELRDSKPPSVEDYGKLKPWTKNIPRSIPNNFSNDYCEKPISKDQNNIGNGINTFFIKKTQNSSSKGQEDSNDTFIIEKRWKNQELDSLLKKHVDNLEQQFSSLSLPK